MPGTRPSESQPGAHSERVLREELLAVSILESLSARIRALTLSRQSTFARARVHRSEGQLVPGSLDQEIAENGLELQQALDQYAELTAGGAGAAEQ